MPETALKPEVITEDANQESQLINLVNPVVEQANQIRVTEQTFNSASGFLKQIKVAQKRINDHFDPLIGSAHQTHKLLCAKKKEVELPLKQAEFGIKSKIGVYLQEQKQERLVEEARLREIQHKLEDERKIQQAEMAEAVGENGLADQILEEPINTPATVIPRVARHEGISTSKTWHIEVTDLRALIVAVAEGKAPTAFLLPNEKALRQQAVSLHGEFKCLGIRVYSRTGVSTRI